MNDVTLKEAKRLYRLGFAILWLHPKSKRPIGNSWATGPRKSWDELKSSYREGYNVGVRTGEASKIGKHYLACIDVDVKNPAFKDRAQTTLKNLTKAITSLIPEVRSGSGGGSRHIYVLTKKPFKMLTVLKDDGGEVCVYSNGRQMVLPPSIHPNGLPYKWKHPVDVAEDLPVIDFEGVSDSLLPTVIKPFKKKTDNEKFTFEVKKVDTEFLPISDDVLSGIISGEGITDRSAFLLPATVALVSAGLSRDEVLTVLTDPENYISSCARDHRKTNNRTSQAQWLWDYTVKKVFEERKASSMFTSKGTENKTLTGAELEAQNEEFAEARHWTQDLDRTQHGTVKPSLKNLNLILSHVTDGPLFKKDMFANRIAYGSDSPWGSKAGAYLEDIDVILIKHWLGTGDFNFEPSKDALFDTTMLIAHNQREHPVRDYLNSLKWDGAPRVNTWLKNYCEAQAAEPYLSEVSRKFLLAMVRRIFEPGCQWDYVLVLQGKQGRYKSSIARALASDKWFMDNLPDLKDKDAMLNLQGKWLIELGELANVKRTDYNQVKAYLVRRVDTVRGHYGRIPGDHPRQSVFIGTVNEDQYLKDPTGNRRYWPVKVGMCDVKGLKKVRDQLFAEAVHIYRTTNEVLMLSPKANNQAHDAQDERRVDDEVSQMQEHLIEFIIQKNGEFDWSKFKAKDLFNVGGPWSDWRGKNYAYQNAAAVLSNMGFARNKVEGQRVWRVPNKELLAQYHKKKHTKKETENEDFF